MSIHYPTRRVKLDPDEGIIEQDTGSWPDPEYVGEFDHDCKSFFSDNSASTPKLNLITDVLAMGFTCRRAGTPVLPYGDFQTVKMHDPIEPPLFNCTVTAAMRDAEIALDNLLLTAGSDKYDIRLGSAVLGMGVYVQTVAQAPYTARLKVFSSAGGPQVGVSVIRTATSYNAYTTPPFEGAVWLCIARDAADAADFVQATVEVVSGTVSPLTDAAFDASVTAGNEARAILGQIIIGPVDPVSSSTTFQVPVADIILFSEDFIPGDPEGPITSRSKLCVPFNLPDCSVYANPENAAALLPEVYGDFTFGGLRGAVPAVCIDTVNFVYAAAGHGVASIIAVFVDDEEQTIGVDCTITLATDYEGQGILAIIVFPAAPSGQVSWRGGGRVELDGSLITNPIRQLEYALRRRAGFVTEYFEATALAQAKFDCDTMGYQTAWVIGDDREIQQWLTEWLFNVTGFWRVDGRERLQFTIDTGGSPPESQIVGSIIASRDVVDGDDGVEMLFDRQHLVNDLTAYYLYSWSLDQPSSRIVDFSTDVIAQRSKNAHGEVRKAVTLRGLRVETMLRTWANILFQRQGFASRIEGAILSFTAKHAKLIHATIGDVFAFTWPWGPTREEGNAYVNELIRIVTVNHDFARGGKTRIRAIDLGVYVSASESAGQGAYFDADDADQYNAELFFGGGRLLVPLP